MPGNTIAERLAAWSDAHTALIEAAVAATRILYATALGTPERTAARQNRQRLLQALARHEAQGIKAVDQIAAASAAGQQLASQAAAAKTAALKLAKATETINQVTAVLNQLTGLVNVLAPLPGLFGQLAL